MATRHKLLVNRDEVSRASHRRPQVAGIHTIQNGAVAVSISSVCMILSVVRMPTVAVRIGFRKRLFAQGKVRKGRGQESSPLSLHVKAQ